MDLEERVAAAANPPVEYGRYGVAAEDLHQEILLDDLVQANSFVDREIKSEFLSLFVNDEDFYEVDPEPNVALTNENVVKFASMNPEVDLDSLRTSEFR